jgi:hypothetical protein
MTEPTALGNGLADDIDVSPHCKVEFCLCRLPRRAGGGYWRDRLAPAVSLGSRFPFQAMTPLSKFDRRRPDHPGRRDG